MMWRGQVPVGLLRWRWLIVALPVSSMGISTVVIVGIAYVLILRGGVRRRPKSSIAICVRSTTSAWRRRLLMSIVVGRRSGGCVRILAVVVVPSRVVAVILTTRVTVTLRRRRRTSCFRAVSSLVGKGCAIVIVVSICHVEGEGRVRSCTKPKRQEVGEGLVRES